MTETTLNSLDPQDPLSGFLFKLVRSCATADDDFTIPGAVLAARSALGGGARADAILAAFAAVMAYDQAVLPKNSCVLDEEDLADLAANRIVLPMQAERLQARIDTAEAALFGKATCPVQGCGSKAHSRGREPRTLLGKHGPIDVRLRKATCLKSGCGHTFAVAGAAIGLGAQRFTPSCAAAITMAATALPHGKAVSLLGQLLNIEVSEHATQDLVQARGEALAALDEAAAQLHKPYEQDGLERIYGRPTDAVPANDAPDVAYLEIDGVLPMTRELLPEQSVEVPGARGGKGRKFHLEGREVKNAVLYTAADHAQEMPSRGCLLRKRYVSHLGHWSQFALLVWLTMLQLRFDQAKLLVVLSDGADWIRSFAKWLPMPKRVLTILDFFHAAHRIWEVARLLHGDGTEQCKQLAGMWCEVVEQGHVAFIIKELKEMRDSRVNVQEKIDALAKYFDNNKDRMDYPEYRQRGLRITSGIVESANFHVTGARLKQQGMRWSEKGAREIAALRADLCNDRWAIRSRQLLAA